MGYIYKMIRLWKIKDEPKGTGCHALHAIRGASRIEGVEIEKRF